MLRDEYHQASERRRGSSVSAAGTFSSCGICSVVSVIVYAAGIRLSAQTVANDKTAPFVVSIFSTFLFIYQFPWTLAVTPNAADDFLVGSDRFK